MPIYDYKCRKCGSQFELLVLKTTIVACPDCASAELDQLISSGFAVSSESSRQTNLQRARKRYANSNDRKDKQVAEAEHIREHQQEGH